MTTDEIDKLARWYVDETFIIPDDTNREYWLSRRLVQLLDERKVVGPRVWRGRCATSPSHWLYVSDSYSGADPYWHWMDEGTRLDPGDIFVPGNQPRPTSPPGPVEDLPKCSEVDW